MPIPKFDRQALIDLLDSSGIRNQDDHHSPRTAGLYKPQIGERLLDDMFVAVQSQVPRPIYRCCSFARRAWNGAMLREHTDRAGLDWTVSINVQTDREWAIEVMLDSEWQSFVSAPDTGMLVNSGVLRHRRQAFEGNNAYQLFLHYTENPHRIGDIAPASNPPYQVRPNILNQEDITRIYHDIDESDLVVATENREGNITDKRKGLITWLRRPKWLWLYQILHGCMTSCNMDWNRPIGKNVEEIQFARYLPGGFYDWHVDRDNTNKRSLSMSVLLRETGGGFELKNVGVIPLSPGDGVVFHSETWHRAMNVGTGTRDALVLWLSEGTPC